MIKDTEMHRRQQEFSKDHLIFTCLYIVFLASQAILSVLPTMHCGNFSFNEFIVKSLQNNIPVSFKTNEALC